ncbi:MAG: phosphotransferase [Defluviitaleaceae bacterium]|nr:phosphotransferase [Defluviitaleaceae bacterium]
MECILSEFDIPGFFNISEIRNNIWDIDDAYILKKTNDFDCVKKITELTRQLSDKGVLAVRFIAANNGEFYVKHDDEYFALMHKVRGGHMDIHNGDSMTKAKQIGENTALLCRTFESCVYDGGPRFEYDMIKFINGEYGDATNRGIERVSKEILGYINDFHPLYKKLPRQIIHKDLNPSNIMFDGDKFQGFIDFDMVQRNVRIYDLCYLLQDVFQNNPEIAKCIYESYDKINPLTQEEKQAIPYMLVMIGVLESIWTFNHGDNMNGDKKSLSDFHIKRTEWMFENRLLFAKVVFCE